MLKIIDYVLMFKLKLQLTCFKLIKIKILVTKVTIIKKPET